MVTTRRCTDYEFNAAVNQKPAKTGVQVLQTFVFCVVTVNNEYTKARSKRKLRALF